MDEKNEKSRWKKVTHKLDENFKISSVEEKLKYEDNRSQILETKKLGKTKHKYEKKVEEEIEINPSFHHVSDWLCPWRIRLMQPC